MYSKHFTFIAVALLFLGCNLEADSKVNTVTKGSYSEQQNRCPKDQKWTEKNIAKWLHEPLERIKQVKIARSLDNTALCTFSAKKLARSFDRLDNPERPDKPDQAAMFRTAQQSVNGVLKPDGLLIATEQRNQIVNQSKPVANIAGIMNIKGAANISSDNWTDLGPGNIGGRTRAMYIHPQDTDIIFIGSVGGGIWKSSDGGNSWSAVNDFMGNITITSIVADPRTTANVATTVLYASTGEGFYNGDSLRGYGIFKSTDGGTTWSQLTSTDPTTTDPDWYYTNRLAINVSGVIIAVTRDNGVFTSKDDGASWTKSAPGPDYYSMMEDVKFDPNDNTKAIVGSVNGNCYYTTDSGITWNNTNIVDASSSWITGRVEIAYGTASNVVYASVDNDSGEIYRSTDGGLNWILRSTPQHLGNQGWYSNTIWVDPTDSDHLIIGGLDLYSSTDGGLNWTQISTWYYEPNSPHADHHMIMSDPNYNGSTNKKVYFSNDGGVYRADDVTVVNGNSSNNGWSNLNNGLSITQFYCAAGISGSKITGGTQDNGSLLQSIGSTSNWQAHFGGDGGFSGVSKHATNAGEYYYFGEYVYLQIHRSDNGAQGDYIYDHGLNDANTNNANFIAPFMIDPNNDSTMLAGGLSFWRSANVSTANPNDITWTSIKSSIGEKISQITVAEGSSDVILVGYNNGEIYKTTNGTSVSPTWTQVHTSNGKFVLALMIDKSDTNILYAGWGGFASGNLKKSINGGVSWTDISGGLPETPMRSIVRNPTNPDYLYVGTEVGIFTSEDQGAHWFTTNDGPANVSVDKLFWYDSTTLIAATHGRGVFRINLQSNSTTGINPGIITYLLN